MPINPSPAVVRACAVLDELARHPSEPLSLAEVARRVDAPRATCDSVLLALASRGYVVRNDDLRYALGPRCVSLGAAARAANPVVRATAIEAEHVGRNLSACVAVSTRDREHTRVAEVFDFGPAFGIRTQPGQSIALRPPFGAVFLAWGTDDDIEDWLDRAELTDPIERSRYREALHAVRQRGFSVTTATDRRPDLVTALETLAERPDAEDARRRRDELARQMTHSEYLATAIDDGGVLRVSQMSAPVFDRAGRVAAAIMLLGPNYDVTSTDIKALGEELSAAAYRATRSIGGEPPDALRR